MARITIDVTSAFHQSAGIGRLTRETIGVLGQLQTRHHLQYFCMGRPASAGGRTQLREFQADHPLTIAPLDDRNLFRLWFRAGIPVPVTWFAGSACDLYHATDFVLPPLPVATKSVVTVHDLTFERDPDSTVPSLLAFLRKVVPKSARQATHVIADSIATARDLTDLYAIPESKITVIYCGVSSRFRPSSVGTDGVERAQLGAKYGFDDRPYVLAVGTMQRRKNHISLVRAFASQADTSSQLVIAGGKGWLYDEVQHEVNNLGLERRVRFTGFVDEADLPALYRQARVFAFPSVYEGFGLPLLEAMACGTPVISSDRSSLPEVMGPVGLQVAPMDVNSLAGALNMAWSDVDWRSAQIAAGLNRAARFTWEKSAQQLLDVYDRVLFHG